MHCRVNDASNTSSLHFFTNNKQYYSLIFCATPTNCTWNLQKSRKANLSRLVKPADLSQILPAYQPMRGLIIRLGGLPVNFNDKNNF